MLLGSIWRCCWMQTLLTACWVTQFLWTLSKANNSSWKRSSVWSCQAFSLQQRGNGWSSNECSFQTQFFCSWLRSNFFKNSHISLSFTFRHFQGFSVAKLSRTMTANIEKLLLSDTKSDSASRWRQDGLFNFCYSLLFRYHISSRFPFVQWKCSCC